MKSTLASAFLTCSLFAGTCLAAEVPSLPMPETDQQRIDSLIHQNQLLAESLASLRNEVERPRTREEAFATCMQAARGTSSAMAAESIGAHCDKLLRQ